MISRPLRIPALGPACLGVIAAVTVACGSSTSGGEGPERSAATLPSLDPNGPSTIVFAARAGATLELFSMEPDGDSLTQLTEDGSLKTALAATSDGSHLAFAAITSQEESEAGVTSVFAMDADGANVRTLCEACGQTAVVLGGEIIGLPDSLAWSPDGSTLAVAAPPTGVLLIDVETSETSRIETTRPISALAWSSSGSHLALSRTWWLEPGNSFGSVLPVAGDPDDATASGGIDIVQIESGQVEDQISTEGIAYVHGWTSDDVIAFMRLGEDGHPGQLTAFSPADERSWTLVPGERGAADLGAAWSPTGDRVALLTEQYDEDSRGAKELRVVPKGGGAGKSLPMCEFDRAFDGDNCAKAGIVWSPDGSTLAYRAIVHGTPAGSVIVLQGVDDPSTSIVPIGDASFDIGRTPCCLVWILAGS